LLYIYHIHLTSKINGYRAQSVNLAEQVVLLVTEAASCVVQLDGGVFEYYNVLLKRLVHNICEFERDRTMVSIDNKLHLVHDTDWRERPDHGQYL